MKRAGLLQQMDKRTERRVPGVDVTVESELCFVLECSDGAGISETPYLSVALRRN